MLKAWLYALTKLTLFVKSPAKQAWYDKDWALYILQLIVCITFILEMDKLKSVIIVISVVFSLTSLTVEAGRIFTRGKNL